MQPYFFPYLGYFQLINFVDKFVVYDNIEYTKKGWINRNRYLCNGRDKYFTIPIARDSDFLDVRDRKLACNFDKEKLKKQIQMAYIKAPYFTNAFSLFCSCVDCECNNLFDYIYNSIKQIADYLSIDTEIVISSSLHIEEELKGRDKVVAICKKLGTTEYINPIGGMTLYDKRDFLNEGIKLSFIKMLPIHYKQFDNNFVESLSILDVMMFNSTDEIIDMLGRYRFE